MKVKHSLQISEVFSGIQAEGRYVGLPVLFIRCGNCTRHCSYCDTKYHKVFKEVSLEKVVREINEQSLRTIIITGGEPTLQWNRIVDLWRLANQEKHFTFHLETNGDLLYAKKVPYSELLSVFDYVAISPKEACVARQLSKDISGPLSKGLCDIKVVTDLEKVGRDMIRFATILMPLTTGDVVKDEKIRRKVWNYCVKKGIRYSPRLHIEIWGYGRRGV
jgi:organic radical activating enzyme